MCRKSSAKVDNTDVIESVISSLYGKKNKLYAFVNKDTLKQVLKKY